VSPVRLLLDEHYAPNLAVTLRAEGYDVEALLDVPDRAGLSAPEVFVLAAGSGQRIVTENVTDFRPLLLSAAAQGSPVAPLLFVRAVRFPRRGGAPALLAPLRTWLEPGAAERRDEDWL